MKYTRTSRQSNLNDSLISDMRFDGMRKKSHTAISKKFNVHRKTVYNVINRFTWNHVPDPVRAYGFPNHLIFPDGRVYSSVSDKFIKPISRKNGGDVVRITTSGGKKVTTPISTLVARGYHGTRAKNPKITYIDGNPRNVHFTNIKL
jgi:hypothetical protein